MSFSPADIPPSLASVSAAAFVGRHHVAEGYFFDGRAPEYRAFFAARPAPRPLWTSACGRYSVAAVEDPDFEVPPTAVLNAPDFVTPPPVLLRHAARTVGFYYGGMAWIDREHRGRGLAPMMILAGCVAAGGPTYDTESTMGFSAAGFAAHLAAHREAVRIAAGQVAGR
jgi:hypothetical protein